MCALSVLWFQLAAAQDRYGSKPFLNLFVVRHHAFSRDVVLRRVHLEVDTLEVEIDADMLNGLNVRTENTWQENLFTSTVALSILAERESPCSYSANTGEFLSSGAAVFLSCFPREDFRLQEV